MQKQILVVDDDLSVLRTVTKLIERMGYSVITASSGAECIKICEKGFEGLVLMDVVMPGMDGWDTIKELVDKNLIDNILICMLTGEDNPSEKMDKLKEYVVDYITKPFDAKQLISIIDGYAAYLA